MSKNTKELRIKAQKLIQEAEWQEAFNKKMPVYKQMLENAGFKKVGDDNYDKYHDSDIIESIYFPTCDDAYWSWECVDPDGDIMFEISNEDLELLLNERAQNEFAISLKDIQVPKKKQYIFQITIEAKNEDSARSCLDDLCDYHDLMNWIKLVKVED